MFIDIHCHLNFYKKKEIDLIIKRANYSNVKIINNSLNPKIDNFNIYLKEKYPEIKIALGSYPIDALKLSEKELENQIEFIKKNKEKISAIGEVGIDLKESNDFGKQKSILIKFIRLSKEINKPLIIHSRKAEEKTIEILEKLKTKSIIIHCFNGNLKLVKRIIKNNWYLSIPTIVTFSSHFQKIIEITPIENLFCETDSPFLHPIKNQKNNEPSNVVYSYKKIAEIKKIPLEIIEEKIKENFSRLFQESI